MADAAPICTTGVVGVTGVQTLVGRFAFGAGSVALSQTFVLGGQTVVLGGQTRGSVHEPAQGALSSGNCDRTPSPRCCSGNPCGVGSAERNFGASTRRLKRGVQAGCNHPGSTLCTGGITSARRGTTA